MKIVRTALFALCAVCLGAAAVASADPPYPVYVVPNFHPASCGWLTDWSTERNYCANSYLDHLDRVRDDPNYSFALSECNNLIAILNFQPQRFEELKSRIRQGRVELVNAFFLEPTINLSGGEALVKMGVEGLRWQRQMMGVRPRLNWMIDVTGTHEQMAQITAGLGLEAFVYCRLNPTGSTLHWLESPDGTRTLAVSPGNYAEWRALFTTANGMDEKQITAAAEELRTRLPSGSGWIPQADRRPRRTPQNAAILIFSGSGDYSLAPLNRGYPSAFLRQFMKAAPEFDVKITTPGAYLDAVLPRLKAGQISLPTMRGGTEFTYKSFWIQNPRVKSWYRRCEQQLQSAEMLATAASVGGDFAYPAQELYHAWLQMLLNMDRNTLWGAAGGMVFEHARSWDVRDRFEGVERISGDAAAQAARALTGKGRAVAVFNPLSWPRSDPARFPVAVGNVSQKLPGDANEVLCRVELPSAGITVFGTPAKTPEPSAPVPLPPFIETAYYRARVDPSTGALTSLALKPSGKEMLGGPANVIVAEQPQKKSPSPGDHMVDRPERNRIADSGGSASKLTVSRGPLATIVTAESPFPGSGRLRRTMTFYHDNPRIDFETELTDVSDRTVVLAEFPLGAPVLEVRRGIPYGFAHAAWSEPNPALHGVAKGITPAVRWSHYQMRGAGLALLDRGLTGREINGNTPVMYLLNAVGKYNGYTSPWLSGAGRHVLHYALVAHSGDFAAARVPQAAWEFNNPPQAFTGAGAVKPRSFMQASDNVVVEAMRREGAWIEVRLVECLGRAGTARVTLTLPHRDAALTDLTGDGRKPLNGGPAYTFAVRPQQIVTLRFRTEREVPAIQPLTEWDDLVPPSKREALRRYQPGVKGHPPTGDSQP